MSHSRRKIHLFRVLRQERWYSIDVYADRLVNSLERIIPSDYSVEAVCPSDWHLPGWRGGSLYLNRGLRYSLYAWRHQGDINHVLDNSYGHLVHFLDSRRTIVTSHGGTPVSWRRWNREGPAMWFFDWAFSGMLKAAHIIVVSEYSKRELLADYVYDPQRIHVIHHGVDEHFVPLQDETVEKARLQYKSPDEAGIILHVGHCAARKNIETLLIAFAHLLHATNCPYRLLQVGGFFTVQQRALIERLGIANRVTQIPYMPNENLVALYNAATAFVFPSLYEGFGIPLIEAMACGTPIVCTDWELFHEVCGDAAVYANTRDADALTSALMRVLASSELQADLRRRGLLRAREFSWQRCAQATLAVYQRMIGQ
jgi:glycosyltransferase involved in cell wall biosynthesis